MFAGDYGPLKTQHDAAIENDRVVLSSHGKKNDAANDQDDHDGRHPMYKYAGKAQKILLEDEHVHHDKHDGGNHQ